MTRVSQLLVAAFFAAIVGIAGLVPLRAATMPAGAAALVDQASRPQADSVQYRYRRVSYRPRASYRPVYYRARPVYRPARVYYRPVARRCVMRPRVVWTRYGYVRRWVRVCRY